MDRALRALVEQAESKIETPPKRMKKDFMSGFDPAEPLRNTQHEKFCHALIESNGNPKKTMAAAGLSWNASYYTQMKKKPKVAARIKFLQDLKKEEKILSLERRMEVLSTIATDETIAKGIRIKALHELHAQSGESKVRIDVNSKSEQIIQHVEIALPKITAEDELKDITAAFIDDELKDIDSFLSANKKN